jgi:hypothetical protein
MNKVNLQCEVSCLKRIQLQSRASPFLFKKIDVMMILFADWQGNTKNASGGTDLPIPVLAPKPARLISNGIPVAGITQAKLSKKKFVIETKNYQGWHWQWR